MSICDRIVNILKHSDNFFFATDNNGQPSVRPFNKVLEYDGKIYLYTNNRTSAYLQMKKNPKVGICAMVNEDRWLKISANVEFDDRVEVKKAMLEANPGLKKNYSENDKIFVVFSLNIIKAKIHSNFDDIEVLC